MANYSFDFSNLPKYRQRNDWSKSIGLKYSFIYNDISGEMTILDYRRDKENDKSYVLVRYNENVKWFDANSLTSGKIGTFIGYKRDYTGQKKRQPKELYSIGDVVQLKDNELKIVGVGIRRPKNGAIINGNKNAKTQIIYQCLCKKCGFITVKTQSSLTGDMKDCVVCHNKIIIPGYNDITAKEPWMIQFFENEQEASLYFPHSNKKIFPICPICGKKSQKQYAISQLADCRHFTCGCSFKRRSYPEKFISALLSQLNINYIPEYSFLGRRYDFYLPEYKCIIETHGLQHYKEICFNKNHDISLYQQQKIDQKKMENALHYFAEKYIVLDCRKSNKEWIKNTVVSSTMSSILNFNVNDINWDACEQQALNSIVEDVWDDYQNNLLSIEDLCEKYEKSRHTIIKYLKNGHKYKKCYFNPYYSIKNNMYLIYNEDNPYYYCATFKDVIALINKITNQDHTETYYKKKQLNNEMIDGKIRIELINDLNCKQKIIRNACDVKLYDRKGENEYE